MNKTFVLKASMVALLAISSAASAGSLTAAVSGGTVIAAQNFGATASTTTNITPGVVTYTIGTTNGIVINGGGKVYFTMRLAGGKFNAAPANTTVTGTIVNQGGAGNGAVGAGVLSSDSTTVQFPITFTNSATLGVGTSIIFTPAATSIDNVNTTLATAGGVVNMTASLSAVTPVVVAPSTTTAPNTGTAQAADIDAPAGTAAIALSANAYTAAVSALAGYTGKIDLTITPTSSNYALSATPGTAVVAKLGSVTFTDAATVANQLNGVTAFNIGAAKTATSTTIDVTPGAGQSFPIGSVLSVSSANDQCAAANRVGSLAAFTATTNTAKATVTVPAANTVSGTAIEVCLTAPSAGNVATPITPTITGTLSATAIATTTANVAATGTGYALDYNGVTKTVRNYIPAAVTGFAEVVRITNTGLVAAAPTIKMIGENGAQIGTPFVGASLAAGATVKYTQAQIETGVGATAATLPATARPRLTITAPTNAMEVQTFALSNGVYTSVHGVE